MFPQFKKIIDDDYTDFRILVAIAALLKLFLENYMLICLFLTLFFLCVSSGVGGSAPNTSRYLIVCTVRTVDRFSASKYNLIY